MKERQIRHDVIRELVRTSMIKTQDELVAALTERGFECTQATVSRDIKDIGLEKITRRGYVLGEDLRLESMVGDLVVELNSIDNFVLVKAQSGTAPGVAAALDDAKIDGVLGSVSGDDTILVVCGSANVARALYDTLSTYRKG
ncbi:MAG: ArgR family transcriptional regulator [Coriobacteriia bacterium]|nr:ArgR family transcriptional regulator [Coriobacteriia bacterium]